MITRIPRYLLSFVLFILFQVFILNKIELSGYLNPFLYILFIISLPFETPGWLLLILAGITGLTIDLFLNSAGIHMASCVLIAYIRPYVLRSFAPRDNYEPGTLPLPSYYGFPWFAKYAIILIVVHHFCYFFIESFGVASFVSTIVKTAFSSIFTLLIMLIALLFTYTRKRRN